MSVTLNARVRISPEVLHQQVRDEVVILDLGGEQYYGLNAVGSRIWDLLDGDHTLGQVAEIITREFDAPAAQVQDDLRALLDTLVAAGLVVIVAQ
ncbi:PqqD family protein [uncultured Thiodictyon sp.]|jgi:hypothetical protein|uniref:PqqD family protein n=1 Tax=uncultured Thiodictyon sp. TaxID=1846217 RepID=UPI0025CC6B35|nr:PqqD family protein [uncultured Thiodictyon sp.]